VTASFAVSGDTAVIEMAEAAGLRRLPGGRPAPLTATTYGVGELILAALDRGVRRVVLGVGGSATTDGGTGMARALGVRFLDADVRDLPPGGAALRLLHTIDMARLDPRLGGVEVVVASDVDNPLTGDRGAAAAFSHSRSGDQFDPSPPSGCVSGSPRDPARGPPESRWRSSSSSPHRPAGAPSTPPPRRSGPCRRKVREGEARRYDRSGGDQQVA
jgi:Glycerate kinase family